MNLIGDVRSLHLSVDDLDRSLEFYVSAWGLERVGTHEGSHYLRGSGTEHHLLQLSNDGPPGLRGVTFASPGVEKLKSYAELVARDTKQAIQPLRSLPAAAGGGVGLDLKSPEGLQLSFTAGVASHETELDDRSRPTRLTHVVINSGDLQTQLRFFIDQLGFQLSDNTERQYFLRSGFDHHSLAIAIGEGLSLNHAAFETRDFDSQMHASGRVIARGTPIEWGPGRHGPGNNIFCYFIDPDGFAIEYTTEVLKIAGAHDAHDADHWANQPRRPCLWGIAGRPSARMIDAFGGPMVTGSPA